MTRPNLRVFLNGWFCGCGNPELACARLRDILKLHPLYDNREALKALIPDTGMEMLVLYFLDHLDLTEHGGGIGGAWLTDKGKAVLEALEREAGDGFETLTGMCCVHGYSVELDDHESCEECK